MLQLALLAFNVSAGVILLQLVQTRIFGVVFWNHLVYFIISIALLGFGVSGTWLALGRSTWLARSLSSRRAAAGFVISTLVTSLWIPHLGVSIAFIFENVGELGRLLFVYFAAAFPYFFAGWILGTLFRDNANKIHMLYFADLVGAAAGCLIFLTGIRPLGAVHLILISCALVATPALFLHGTRARKWITAGILALTLTGIVKFEEQIGRSIVPEATKSFQRDYTELASGDRRIVEFSEWNAISRIDVVSTLKDPDTKRIMIDGDAWTAIVVNPPSVPPPFNPERDALLVNMSPYLLHENPESVLVIGAGGGIDVWNALRAGAKEIDAVEINPTTVAIGLERYRAVNNELFHRNGVQLWNEEGRSFVRRSKKQYDVIMMHAIDTFAALNAGAYMLSENYLYTTDAIVDYLNHLKPGGTLCITRWAQPAEATRLFTTALEALYVLGVSNPPANIVATQTDWVTVLVRKTPFSPDEIRAIQDHVTRNQATMLHPVSKIERRIQGLMNDYVQLRASNRQDQFFSSVNFDTRPTGDDSPFFFHYEKWGNLLRTLQERGIFSWVRGNWPPFTLVSLFAASLLAVLAFIGAPLLLTRQETVGFRNFGTWVVYFSSLGISFIFIEISLMQRFALLLGHPSRALALILGTLLFSAGVGSFFSERAAKQFVVVFLTLVGLTLLAAYVYPTLIYLALPLPLWVRGVITFILVFPLGLCMGMPFPSGIRRVSEQHESAVPWMWGINGGTTVLGSLLAIIVAMNSSFTAVLAFAAVGYLVAALSYLRVGTGKA